MLRVGVFAANVFPLDRFPPAMYKRKEQRTTVEERQLAEPKAQDHDWAEIAAMLGGTPEARRKQLARAIDRVAQDLGLDEGSEESAR
jgi:hypothetical protein